MIVTIRGFESSIVPVRLFFTTSAVVLFLVSFWLKLAVFTYLRNVTSHIDFLKIKTPEHSDPPSEQFFFDKASISTFVSCRKVALCQSGRVSHLLKQVFFLCLSVMRFFCAVISDVSHFLFNSSILSVQECFCLKKLPQKSSFY